LTTVVTVLDLVRKADVVGSHCSILLVRVWKCVIGQWIGFAAFYEGATALLWQKWKAQTYPSVKNLQLSLDKELAAMPECTNTFPIQLKDSSITV
jgi:hypothetical protein